MTSKIFKTIRYGTKILPRPGNFWDSVEIFFFIVPYRRSIDLEILQVLRLFNLSCVIIYIWDQLSFQMHILGLFVHKLYTNRHFFLFQQSTENHINIFESSMVLFYSLLALGIQAKPTKNSTKILCLSICIAGALVFWSYSAGLTSLLTVENYEYPVKSFEASVSNLLCHGAL